MSQYTFGSTKVPAFASFQDLIRRLSPSIQPDEIITTQREKFAYRVLPSDASNPDLVTDQGIKLEVQPGDLGFNVCAFGAVADGNVDAGTGTDNYATIQKAADRIQRLGGGTLFFPKGTFRLSYSVRLHSHTRVFGEGTVWNDRTEMTGETLNNFRSPFLLGYWALAAVGYRPPGDNGPFNSSVDAYSCAAPTTRQQNEVTLANPADAAAFKAGDIVYLRSQEHRIQTSTSIELILPDHNQLVKVQHINDGSIFFEHPIGFETATPPLLCRIQSNTSDNGMEYHFVENVDISGVHLVGQNAFGNNNTGAYNCRLHDLTFDCTHMIQANGFAHCVVNNLSGRFEERLCEVKFCAHDSLITNIVAQDKGTPRAVGTFSIGEGAFGIQVSGFDILAARKTGGQIFQLQPGHDCRFSNGRICAPNSNNNPIYFYADANTSMHNVTIENVSIVHGSDVHVVFAGGVAEPESCNVTNCRIETTSPNTQTATVFHGGRRNQVSGTRFSGGGVQFLGNAEGNIYSGNISPDAGIGGSQKPMNQALMNYQVAPTGTELIDEMKISRGLKISGSRDFSRSGYGIEFDGPATYGRIRAVDRSADNALIPFQLHGNNLVFISGADTSSAIEAMRINASGYMFADGVGMLAPNGTLATKPVTSADLADQTHAINTRFKRLGALVLDVSNLRVLVALGQDPTAEWRSLDGTGGVIPA